MTAPSTSNAQHIVDRLKLFACGFEATLSQMLVATPEVPPILAEAVRYSVEGGGKRVRPYIVTRIAELCGGTAEQAAPAAVALECIHAFSLVHDDLPAMDNDDLRRGRPTCHKAYGEAVGILAGDALFALAFEIAATRFNDTAVAAAIVAELAQGSGWAGMIGGQTDDIMGEGQPIDLELIERIHRGKTARLFQCAGRIGALSVNARDAQVTAAANFGEQLGRAFQIADDLLDATGSAEDMGKAVAKDLDAGKQTYPAAVGIERSREAAQQAMQSAIAALEIFGPEAEDLRELARFVVERKS